MINKRSLKKKIMRLFEKNEILYFSDISKKLNLDLQVVVEHCKELLKEGKIGLIK